MVATTTTDTSGNYLFSNVNAGDYKVQVVTPTGYYVTKQDQGRLERYRQRLQRLRLHRHHLPDIMGQTLTKVDAGLYRKASVGDKVWMDFNNNGLQDSGDRGVANVTVKLLDAAGVLVATTKTDAYGCYSFTNLNPGQCQLVVRQGVGLLLHRPLRLVGQRADPECQPVRLPMDDEGCLQQRL